MKNTTGCGPFPAGTRTSTNWFGSWPYGSRRSAAGGFSFRTSSLVTQSSIEQLMLQSCHEGKQGSSRRRCLPELNWKELLATWAYRRQKHATTIPSSVLVKVRTAPNTKTLTRAPKIQNRKIRRHWMKMNAMAARMMSLKMMSPKTMSPNRKTRSATMNRCPLSATIRSMIRSRRRCHHGYAHGPETMSRGRRYSWSWKCPSQAYVQRVLVYSRKLVCPYLQRLTYLRHQGQVQARAQEDDEEDDGAGGALHERSSLAVGNSRRDIQSSSRDSGHRNYCSQPRESRTGPIPCRHYNRQLVPCGRRASRAGLVAAGLSSRGI